MRYFSVCTGVPLLARSSTGTDLLCPSPHPTVPRLHELWVKEGGHGVDPSPPLLLPPPLCYQVEVEIDHLAVYGGTIGNNFDFCCYGNEHVITTVNLDRFLSTSSLSQFSWLRVERSARVILIL